MSVLKRGLPKRGVLRSPTDYDIFNKKALREFDREIYELAKRQTRLPGDLFALEGKLRKYDRPDVQLRHLPPNYRRAILCGFRDAIAAFQLPEKVVPRFLYAVDLQGSRSSGYPYYQKKGDVAEELFADARFLGHLMKRKQPWRIPFPYVTCGSKGSLGEKEDPKTRLVWIYPGAMTIVEGQYAQPLIDAYSVLKESPLMTGRWGFLRQRIFDLERGYDKTAIGLDFKSFDSTVPSFAIEMAFAILARNIDFSKYWDPSGIQTGGSGVEARSRKCYENVKWYFTNTPILTPSGYVYRKRLGVPSGSHFTNLVDSIWNFILIRAVGHFNGWAIKNLMVNGDDSAFMVGLTIPRDTVLSAASRLASAVGMEINLQKSEVRYWYEDFGMSGMRWRSGFATRSDEDLFALALHSKTFTANPAQSFARLIGLFYTGGAVSSKFCEYFRYFQSGYEIDYGGAVRHKDLEWLKMAYGVDLAKTFKAGQSLSDVWWPPYFNRPAARTTKKQENEFLTANQMVKIGWFIQQPMWISHMLDLSLRGVFQWSGLHLRSK